MRLLWSEDAPSLAGAAADLVCALLGRRPGAVLALPTGHTPLGLYAELVRRCGQAPGLGASARYFNLDEYVGLPADHPLDYAGFLQRHFFVPARVDPTRVRLLQGRAPDLAQECRDYDECLDAAGGLDLAILGLGENGHIAFNEPGTAWDTRTHVVQLDQRTRATHRRQSEGRHEIPERGITMGVATIRAARQVLLLASGRGKAGALAALLQGRADPAWPVTSLLGHPDVVVIAERALRPAA